jgi:hypothetical protein
VLIEVLDRARIHLGRGVDRAGSLACIYAAVVVATRVAGPRSLAQMSAFDFVATIAVGSIVASVGLGSVPLVDGLVAVALLFALQFGVATVRVAPIAGGRSSTTPRCCWCATVRSTRTTSPRHGSPTPTSAPTCGGRTWTTSPNVRAVVLETTGDVSVLSGSGDIGPLLQGVRGAEGTPARGVS